MTDDYNSPPGSEGQGAHEENAGTWSNEPPVDDFRDMHSADESATASQENEAQTDEEAAVSSAPARSLWPLFAGVVGLLLLGAVAYWQFGHSSAPPPSFANVPSSSLKAPPAYAAVPGVPSSKTDLSTSGTSDINSLYKPASPVSSQAEVTAPTTAQAPSLPVPVASTSPAGVAMPAQAGLAPSQAAAQIPSLPSVATPSQAPSPVPPSAAMIAAQTAAANASSAPTVAANSSMETRLDDLAARVDSLQKSLDQSAKQLGQANQAASAGVASPAVDERLNKLEQNIMQLEHGESASKPAEMADNAPAMNDGMDASVPAPVSAAVHTKTKHKAVAHKKTKSSHHKSSGASAKASETEAAPHWVLRAAVPGEAWVSASPTDAELRHVQVGDVLPGIGQVSAIRQYGSSWQIEGASGTVR